jgi:hypothetical protein
MVADFLEELINLAATSQQQEAEAATTPLAPEEMQGKKSANAPAEPWIGHCMLVEELEVLLSSVV